MLAESVWHCESESVLRQYNSYKHCWDPTHNTTNTDNWEREREVEKVQIQYERVNDRERERKKLFTEVSLTVFTFLKNNQLREVSLFTWVWQRGMCVEREVLVCRPLSQVNFNWMKQMISIVISFHLIHVPLPLPLPVLHVHQLSPSSSHQLPNQLPDQVKWQKEEKGYFYIFLKRNAHVVRLLQPETGFRFLFLSHTHIHPALYLQYLRSSSPDTYTWVTCLENVRV